MKRLGTLLAAISLLTVLCSCTGKKETPTAGAQRRAAVVLRDGTKITGDLVASSPTEVQISGDDKIMRTIPMDQVKSIEYGEATTPAPNAQTQAGPPVQTAPSLRKGAAPGMPAPQRPGAAFKQETAASPVPAKVYELPAGSHLAIRTNESIDSAKASEGQSFDAQVSKDVLDASGAVAIPHGSQAELVIVSASKGGRFKGASDLVLDLRSVTVNGQRYQLDAADIQQRGKDGVGANKRTATYTGGGAAVGAIIGAIAGGGRGAAIGAGAGAGAGALTQIITKGGSIRVPAETVLTFRLEKPLRVVASN